MSANESNGTGRNRGSFSNKALHPANPYHSKPPDFAALAKKYERFREVWSPRSGIMWSNPNASKIITETLLQEDFKLEVVIPVDRLCPPLPNRLNYICWIADLLKLDVHLWSRSERCLDVGMGASCIYPLLGHSLYRWRFLGSDTDREAFTLAAANLARNPDAQKDIEIVEVEGCDSLQRLLGAEYLNNDDTALSLSGFIHTQLRSRDIDLPVHRGPIRLALLAASQHARNVVLECEKRFTASENSIPASSVQLEKPAKELHMSDFSSMEAHDDLLLLRATMCNPPFYSEDQEIPAIQNAKRAGIDAEMVTPGGEIAFVTAMILDSLILRDRYNYIVCIFFLLVFRPFGIRAHNIWMIPILKFLCVHTCIHAYMHTCIYQPAG
jgi:23S rRNA A1618 N6-methylase RlmF